MRFGRKAEYIAAACLLEKLPDGASFEDIQYAIYVRAKIERGLDSADRSDFATDEEVKAVFARWAPK